MANNYLSSGQFTKDCDTMLSGVMRLDPVAYVGVSELSVELSSETQRELTSLQEILEAGELTEFSDLDWSDFYAPSTEFLLAELEDQFVLDTPKKSKSNAALVNGAIELYSTGGEPALLVTSKGVYSYYRDPDLQKIAPNISAFFRLLVLRESVIVGSAPKSRFEKQLQRSCKNAKNTVWSELDPTKSVAPKKSTFVAFDPDGLTFGLTGKSSRFSDKAFAKQVLELGGELGDETDTDLDVLVVGDSGGFKTGARNRACALVEHGVWDMQIITDAEFSELE